MRCAAFISVQANPKRPGHVTRVTLSSRSPYPAGGRGAQRGPWDPAYNVRTRRKNEKLRKSSSDGKRARQRGGVGVGWRWGGGGGRTGALGTERPSPFLPSPSKSPPRITTAEHALEQPSHPTPSSSTLPPPPLPLVPWQGAAWSLGGCFANHREAIVK